MLCNQTVALWALGCYTGLTVYRLWTRLCFTTFLSWMKTPLGKFTMLISLSWHSPLASTAYTTTLLSNSITWAAVFTSLFKGKKTKNKKKKLHIILWYTLQTANFLFHDLFFPLSAFKLTFHWHSRHTLVPYLVIEFSVDNCKISGGCKTSRGKPSDQIWRIAAVVSKTANYNTRIWWAVLHTHTSPLALIVEANKDRRQEIKT